MRKTILVTGSTGYVGRNLLQSLRKLDYPIRCMVRTVRPADKQGSEEVVRGDVLNPDSLPAALRDVHTAYYLIHSMEAGEGFEQRDNTAASNFGKAAKAAGVSRIIYLGGLGKDEPNLSAHLRSRHKVGDVLRESGVEVIEFRASVVIGAGSTSFEMVRSLVERLPVMIAPRWVSVKSQPIAIADLLDYLTRALNLPSSGSRIFEVGGADQVSYGGLMHEYARQRGLWRLVIPVPLLTPRLSSLWLALVTPTYSSVGKALVDSITKETVVEDKSALDTFPIRPIGFSEAITVAINTYPSNPKRDVRERSVNAPPLQVFAVVQRIGGVNGWYYANWLWKLRGAMDRVVGGVGFSRARRDAENLQNGDVVDFWKVENLSEREESYTLRLQAEMKVPGKAWLEFRVTPDPARPQHSLLKQTAIFEPKGVLGRLYWYGVYPLHHFIFDGMITAISQRAESRWLASATKA